MKFLVLLVTVLGCAAAQRAHVDPRCPSGPNDPRPDIFPDPWSCENYFRCHTGMSMEFTCPAGRHFSPHTNTCEEPRVAGCQQAIAPPRLPSINPPSNRNNNNNDDFLDCPRFDTPGEFVYFAHPQNCQQFFQCSGGRAILLKCPSGHAWNMQRTFCDQERNVQCTVPRF